LTTNWTAGRDQDASALQRKLQDQLSVNSSTCKAAVCIVADAGMGKSALAIDVGWRMAFSGSCPGLSR